MLALVEYAAYAFGADCLQVKMIEEHIVDIMYFHQHNRGAELAGTLFSAGF